MVSAAVVSFFGDLVAPATIGLAGWAFHEAVKLSRQVRENERMMMENRKVLMEAKQAVEDNHNAYLSDFITT